MTLRPFLATHTGTSVSAATTAAAAAMVAVSGVGLVVAGGMMAVAAGFAVAPKAVVRIAAVGEYDPCAGRTDCALRIDSAAQFDRLVASWDLEDRRGPYVSAVVPRVPEADAFCAGHAKCLKTPLFYNRQGNFWPTDFIKENFPDPFVGLSKEQIFEVFFDPWDGSARTAIYDFVDFHRIRQDPSRYGAALHAEPNRATGQGPKLPTLEQVTSLVSGLQRGVELGPVHYYPDGKYQELITQARAWEAAGVPFPIFYETLWANEITSEEQYRTLIGCHESSDPFCRLMLVVPRASKIDEYCAPFREEGKRCLDRIVYANSTFAEWHLDVLQLLAPEQVAGFQGWEAPAELFGTDGVYRTGSLWWTWPDPIYRFSLFVNLGPGGNTPFTPTLADVQEFYRTLRRGFLVPGATFGYVPLSPEEVAVARTWEPQEFRVILPTEGPGYEPYTQGTAYGRLKVLSNDEFDRLQQAGEISWEDIPVLDEAPFDISLPITAVITGTRQVTNASHLSLRMARRNRPNAYVGNARTMFAAHHDQLVKIVVGQVNVTVDVATPAEVLAWQEANRPKIKPPQPINRTYRGLDRVRGMLDEPTSAFSRYGGKVSGLVKLYRVLPQQYQLEAFGIPFSYFLDFIRISRIANTASFPAQCRWAVTYEEFYQRLLASPDIMASPKTRDDCLDAFWEYGKDHGTIPNVTIPGSAVAQNAAQVIATRISELWNDANKDGRDDTTYRSIRVRFRSSSNMEDGLEFNGAGLYESRTVCLLDQYDADTVASCDPNEDHEETVAHALRDVWMSLYLPRAFEERLYWQLPNERVAMGILVNTGTPDERDNGVAFTGNPALVSTWGQNYRRYSIFAQVGETSVVSPDPGVFPEVDEVTIDIRRITGPGDVEVWRSRLSTELPEGQFVLTSAEVKEMGWVLYQIERQYPLDRGPYAPERVILDMEFKHLPSGQLIIKQARPFLIGAAQRFTGQVVLPPVPSGVAAEASADSVQVRWDTGPADALAVIERSFTGSVWTALDTVSAAVGTVADTTVRPGSTYHYRVRLENGFGPSEPSPAVIVTVPQPPQCADAGDNDGDGKIDLADPGCENAEDDDETDPPVPAFRRGDADASQVVDISDIVFTLENLFLGGPNPPCDDAADANDDGSVDIADPVRTLLYLFTSDQPAPPAPGPTTPGPDPTADGLGCARYPAP